MINLIKPAYAAAIDVGKIEGLGPFQTALDASGVKTQTGVFISALVGTLTVVGGLAFVIYFFLGALKWITAGGDKAKVQDAQSSMVNGVIGLVAITAAYFIVGIVGGVLGLDILNPMKILFP
ncbi:MAG TPA: hypothetical protein VF837_02640 [Patescibacteria group bacterium]